MAYRTCRSLSFATTARTVLVIEKEATFRALVEAQIWRRLPLILVTASGMPDIATRAFLKHLERSQLSPAGTSRLSFVGLVDWNPSGCHILMNYKFGGKKRNQEALECALPMSAHGHHHHSMHP
jgi:meiotic recombination protein SPO11